MLILNYAKNKHNIVISACVKALQAGKVIAYPTDTSYGLAVDATNIKAIKRLYKVKGRNFNKPVHIIPPSIRYAKKIVEWNRKTSELAKRFWPGALTLVLGLRAKGIGYRVLSGNSGWLGIRMPKNKIALDLAKQLKRPITTTSANISGKKDCYSAGDILSRFKTAKLKPDIIIDAGRLPKRKPSTVVKIENLRVTILRQGPLTAKQIHA